MADLEAVLADVSYLMAMEKSKSSTSSTKNGRRLTLPDRDSAHVIRRYLTERDLLQFHKVFNERLGFELFAAFCKRKKFNQKAHFHVPMLFYRQIEEFKSSNIEPEDRHNLAREIYDTFVKRELIERQKRQRENDGSPDCNYSPAESPSTKSRKSPMSTSPLEAPPSPGIKTISGFEQSAQEVRHILENDDVIIEPTVFDPFHCALLDLFKRTAWPLFTESREFTRYCQWKNIGSFYLCNHGGVRLIFFFSHALKLVTELSINLNMTDFSVHRIIGRGGFGEVFGCRKVDTGKMYAMKCLDIKRIRLKNGEALALNERKMLQAVSEGEDCPFIVCMTYAFVTADRVCFVLDLMNGGDLHYHLTQHGCFTEPQVRFYAAEVTLGLKHMHERNIVYRDLKPANILLCESGHAKISDLGLACDVKKKLPQAAVGTHGYMAPEVLTRGQTYSLPADWFSLGCMLYKLLKGHSPFRSNKAKDKREIDRRTLEYKPEMPQDFTPELQDLLNGLLTKDPKKRLGTGGAKDIMKHPWFDEVDWSRLARLGYDPPLIPPRGEVNAADAFDIGNFDDDETKGIKLSEEDLAHYENFTTIVSSRWQQEVLDTIWNVVNTERDREDSLLTKRQSKAFEHAYGKDVIIWGPCQRLGGPFQSQWQRKHLFLFPNRLELGMDGDLHVWPLEELIAITDHTHRGYRTIQLSYREAVTDSCYLTPDPYINENQIKQNRVEARLKSQKEFLIKFDSECERHQWLTDLTRTWQEAQRLLKRGPKQISTQRSVKDEAKQKGAIILAQKQKNNSTS